MRELPENLTEIQTRFIKSLDSIYRLHDDREMFVDVVRKIMSELKENPDLTGLLAKWPEDINAMIRGLRQSAGMSQVKKQDEKAKRSKSKTGGGRNSAAVDSALETLQGLANFGG